MASDSVLAALEAALKVLESAAVPYALVGGSAVATWGRFRSTADADLMIAVDPDAPEGKETASRLIEAFRLGGFAHLERADRRRIGDTLVLFFWFPLKSQGVSVRVDLLLSGNDSTHQAVERAVTVKVDGIVARVASCEDLILLKIAAGRPIDLADAKELYAINRSGLDLRYLEETAARMGILKGLRDIMNMTGSS